MKIKLAVAAIVVLAACDLRHLGECLGNGIGDSIGASLGVSSYEKGRAIDRPDDLRDDAGRYFSGAIDGGRLVISFSVPPSTESLPAFHDGDAGCAADGDHAFLFLADAGIVNVNGKVEVAGRVLRCTELKTNVPDGGGGIPLPDRDFAF